MRELARARQGQTRHPERRPLGPVQWVVIASASPHPCQLLVDDTDERRQRLRSHEPPAIDEGWCVCHTESATFGDIFGAGSG
jgi:hypothetical protein